jgi:hypothetical protein
MRAVTRLDQQNLPGADIALLAWCHLFVFLKRARPPFLLAPEHFGELQFVRLRRHFCVARGYGCALLARLVSSAGLNTVR